MLPLLNKEGLDKIMSSLYGGGPAVYGSKEDDVWVLAHYIKRLVDMSADEEDGAGYIYDSVRTLA